MQAVASTPAGQAMAGPVLICLLAASLFAMATLLPQEVAENVSKGLVSQKGSAFPRY